MAKYKPRDAGYNALNNEFVPPMAGTSQESDEEIATSTNYHDTEQEDATGVIIHMVPTESNKGGWTHIVDLDSFFTRMYRYYLKGGFVAMLVSDCFQLFQYCFVVVFLTFLVFCVNYPVLFRDDVSNPKIVGLSDVIYDGAECVDRITWKWWLLVFVCVIVWLVRLARTIYNLYHAYDTKQFYNTALKIKDGDLGWISWCTVLTRVREAQRELHMCIHKPQITELDIYHRILRFNNYLVAMVNKRLLPLHINIPLVGEVPYLSKGLKYNLELILFYGPWSPWENCWQLRECYKDNSKRLELARQLQNHMLILAFLNLLMAPLIQGWQILYFFFSYAELIKRSPGALGLRTWSLFARIYLRHFNELDHELSDRLNRAHKPATKYLSSFPSPVSTVMAKNIAFLSGSVLGVLIALTVYDENVLSVEHMLTLITGLGCILAGARALISEEGIIGQRSSEELLVQVLGHVHYLPASWRGKAHTKNVATHFQQLFQFKAAYLISELLSPIICPFVIYSLRTRALDIVDFYRNFTVSVLGIGDVCSFAQMDVRRHGNPDWPAGHGPGGKLPETIPQCNQGEDGKTELSLVAFSCRNPAWRVPQPNQKKFLQTLRTGVSHAASNYLSGASVLHQNQLQRTMLGSYFHQSMFHGLGTPSALHPALSVWHQKSPDRHLPSMEESLQEEPMLEEGLASSSAQMDSRVGPLVPDKAESSASEDQEMSTSTLHLYDLHLSTVGHNRPASGHHSSWMRDSRQQSTHTSGFFPQRTSQTEGTPLLRKSPP